MSIQLVEGVVTAVDRSPSGVVFAIGERRFAASPEPQAYALEGGQFIHVLACESMESDADEVLVLRRAGGEPVYFGPRLGWPYLALGAALFVAAMISGSAGLMIVPVLLVLVHCDFLARRARVHARFAQELSSRLAFLSVAMDAPLHPGESEAGSIVSDSLSEHEPHRHEN
jgi:hypothetical protein